MVRKCSVVIPDGPPPFWNVRRLRVKRSSSNSNALAVVGISSTGSRGKFGLRDGSLRMSRVALVPGAKASPSSACLANEISPICTNLCACNSMFRVILAPGLSTDSHCCLSTWPPLGGLCNNMRGNDVTGICSCGNFQSHLQRHSEGTPQEFWDGLHCCTTGENCSTMSSNFRTTITISSILQTLRVLITRTFTVSFDSRRKTRLTPSVGGALFLNCAWMWSPSDSSDWLS